MKHSWLNLRRFEKIETTRTPVFTRLRSDPFAQWLRTTVRRVAKVGVDPRAVVEDAAGVRVGAESPLAVVLAHPGVADTPERKVGNQWMDGAIVDHRIPRRRCIEDSLRHALILGEHVQTQWARPGVDEVDGML